MDVVFAHLKLNAQVERAHVDRFFTGVVYDRMGIALGGQIIHTVLGAQVGADPGFVAFFLPEDFPTVAGQQSDFIVPARVVFPIDHIVAVEAGAKSLVELGMQAFPEKLAVAKRQCVVGKIAFRLPVLERADVKAGIHIPGKVPLAPGFKRELALVDVAPQRNVWSWILKKANNGEY